MKFPSIILFTTSSVFIFSSCTPPAQTTSASGASTYQDPNNPYAVPGVTTQGQAAYGTPALPQNPYSVNQQAPYQPIPSTPINPPASIPSYTPPTTTSSSGGSSHSVVSGDTLWGLSRKYGVSVDSIRNANSGISGDTIIPGQTLTIPN